MADRVHPVRAHVVPQLPDGQPDPGVAVVAGVQRPRGGRGQVADVAETQTIAGRQGAGRDPKHAERERGRRRRHRERPGRRGRATSQRLSVAGRVETVPDPGVLLRAAGGQRRVRHTVLRGELLPSGRLHAGQQPGLDRGRAAPAHHEHHRFHMHTAPEPPHDGRHVRGADGRVDGRVRHVPADVQRAGRGRPAIQLGAAGVHTVQRQRQHAGHGAAAVADDRRAVPAQRARHHGRPGAVARLLFHIRHGQGVARPDDGSGNRSDHVAVRGRGRRGRVLLLRLSAGNARQESAPGRGAVQQRADQKY